MSKKTKEQLSFSERAIRALERKTRDHSVLCLCKDCTDLEEIYREKEGNRYYEEAKGYPRWAKDRYGL